MIGGRFSSFKALLSLEDKRVQSHFVRKEFSPMSALNARIRCQIKCSQRIVIHIFLLAVTFKLEYPTQTGTYCALAPDDASLLFSEDVLKSTPPRPILGAAATVGATDVSREPKFNPPAPPRVVCPNPATAGKHKCYHTSRF